MVQYKAMTDEMFQQVVQRARMTDQAVKSERVGGSQCDLQGPPAEPVRGPPVTNAVGWRGVPYGFGMSPEQAAPVRRTACLPACLHACMPACMPAFYCKSN